MHHRKHTQFLNRFICSKWIGPMAELTRQSYEKEGVYTKRERSMGNPRVHQKKIKLYCHDRQKMQTVGQQKKLLADTSNS